MAGHVDPTKEAFAAFRADDRLGPIHMLNLVRLRALAAYPDGRKATGAEAYAAYGSESEPVFSRLGGAIVWRGHFRADADRTSRGALGPVLHRSISERRRLRRHDPRPCLSGSGQAPAGGGGGFPAHPPRAGRGRGRFWLNLAQMKATERDCLLPRSSVPRLNPRMTKPMPWIIGIIGVVFIGITALYSSVFAGLLAHARGRSPQLPARLRTQLRHFHLTHALRALLVALALFAIGIAGFNSSPTISSRDSAERRPGAACGRKSGRCAREIVPAA